MKWHKLLFALFLIGISACSTQIAPVATQTPEPTNKLTSISTPQPTPSPKPKIISGDPYFDGYPYDDPYLLFGAKLRDKMNDSCQGFICGGKDLRLYDPEVWKFLGKGEYGKSVFTFDEPLDTFVITHTDRIGIDALSGKTIDGQTVTYGYLVDRSLTASYMDGSNFQTRTIIEAENKYIPVKTPCGIIDPNPDGDKNYNLTLRMGGIVWNFLDHPFNSAFATRKGYSLISLTIVTESISKITPDQICP